MKTVLDAGPDRASSTTPLTAATTVTVVIPLYNDRAGIGPCLDAITAQQTTRGAIARIFVVDGGSTDGSRAEVACRATVDPRIELLENPDRFVPAALNRALEQIPAGVVVRVDSHAVLDPDYVDAALAALAASGADVVGGHMRPVGDTPVGEAVAWALCSRWGIGGSKFHLDDAAGEADGVYMGVFPVETFRRFGRFDERFSRNQDDEFTYRVCELGGRVWLDPAIRSHYTPRGDFGRLRRQFTGYGRFKPLVLRNHPKGLRARHLAPPAVALAWAGAPVLIGIGVAAGVPVAVALGVAAPVAHLGAVALAARGGGPGTGGWARRARALLTMHLAYGFGFLRGLVGPPSVD